MYIYIYIDWCPAVSCEEERRKTVGGAHLTSQITLLSDIDFCATAGCEHTCQETGGGTSYSCGCTPGYQLTPDQKTCADIDWCAIGGCQQTCEETGGGVSYSCGCSDVHALNTDLKTCRELTRVNTTMVIDINVPSGDLTDPTSQTYQDWSDAVTQTMMDALKSEVPGVSRVIVHSLSVGSNGSLVAETEVVVDEVMDADAVSSLSAELLTLSQGQMTFGNETGDVSIDINGLDVETSSTACQLYEVIRKCPVNSECQMSGGVPVCSEQSSDTDTGTGPSLPLIIGLGVAIGLILLAVAAVMIIAVCIHKRPSDKTRPLLVNEYDRGVYVETLNRPVRKGPSFGPQNIPDRASPAPSFDDIPVRGNSPGWVGHAPLQHPPMSFPGHGAAPLMMINGNGSDKGDYVETLNRPARKGPSYSPRVGPEVVSSGQPFENLPRKEN
ncbi:hypothetical protein BaRGS_00025427, partial [Batillaria attramentaria]